MSEQDTPKNEAPPAEETASQQTVVSHETTKGRGFPVESKG